MTSVAGEHPGAFGIERAIWRIAIVTILGSIMSVLDATVVNVALPALGSSLHAQLAQLQWIVTGYMLALAAVIPLSGWASRRWGAKRVYIVALILFTGGSILCGVAWSTESLIAFRVVQGIGGGMILPVGQMMVARAAGPARMGRVMSILAVPIVLAPVLGPALGGLLLDHVGWRWIFFINIPIGALALVAAVRRLPHTPGEDAGRVDAVGFTLLGVGLPVLTYGLAELGQGKAFASTSVGLPLLLGIALVAIFAWHAARAERPLLDVRLFSNGAFSTASLTTFVLGGVLFGSMILLPLYFQDVRGESAVLTGLLVAPQGVGAALGMPISGRLTDRLGGGIVSLLGVLVTAVATIPFVVVDEHTSFGLISLALVFRGLGIGLAFMPAMSAAYKVLEPRQITDAAPQLNVIQRVGGSIGTALFAVILERALAARAGAPDRLHGLAGAYAHTYWWVVGATVVALLPAAQLARIERVHAHRARSAPAPTQGGPVPAAAESPTE